MQFTFYLQRKHEGIERDLAALEHKVLTLGNEASRLCEIHADHADQIKAKQEEMVKYWSELTAKAKVSGSAMKEVTVHVISTFDFIPGRTSHLQQRKQNLDESSFSHRFLADFRDLMSWINDMQAIIQADELAKDVAGAEALLERHQEHKVY